MRIAPSFLYPSSIPGAQSAVVRGVGPVAAGNSTPTGADGINVAYLFNDGGPSESVEATQVLSETLQPSGQYTLRVAIGNFNPSQPYAASTYGGYRIELLAGTTVIASDTDSFVPPLEEFQDAVALADASTLSAALVGQVISIRLTISATEADRSTHFDNVRLTLTPAAVPSMSPLGLVMLGAILASLGIRLSTRSACLSVRKTRRPAPRSEGRLGGRVNHAASRHA